MLILLLITPAMHKLSSAFPPQWFIEKFSGTFINKIPQGIVLSYSLITFLEVLGPIVLLAGMIKKEILPYGFLVYYALFTILTFGNFLVEDYSNGFNDFMFLVGILLIEHLLNGHVIKFRVPKENSTDQTN